MKMKSRFDPLDSLRAIACFFVIWQHVSETFKPIASSGLWASAIADYLDFGRIGVVAFFCISGFVIRNSLKGNRLEATRTFLIHRFFRLYPIYWLSMLPGILFVWLAWGQDISTMVVLKNATMASSVMGSPYIMGLYWTLEVELAFYFACVLFYFAFGKLNYTVTVIASLCCFILYKFNPLSSAHGHLPTLFYHLFIMFTASTYRCLYDAYGRETKTLSPTMRAAIPQTLVLLILTYLILEPIVIAINNSFSDSNAYWNKFGYANLIGILLFIFFSAIRRTPAFLSNLGKTTYSVYLFHAVVFNAILKVYVSAHLPSANMLMHIILVTTVTLCLSHISYNYIEVPSANLGKTLGKRSYIR